MSSTMRIGLLTLVVLMSLPLAAQSVREVTTVEVVEVPVYVTDHGKPVTGLTREQFRLLVNGKPQSIDYFDVVDFAALSAEDAQNPKQRRLYFLLFDLTSEPFAILRARTAVDKFVQQAGPADVFAVATLSSRGLNVVVPFTRDRDPIRSGVRSLNAETRDPLRLATSSPAQYMFEKSRWDTGDDLLVRNSLTELMEDLAAEPERRRAARKIELLDRLARQLAPLEGHKHVILLSTGFDTSVVLGRSRAGQQLTDVQQGPLGSITERLQVTRSSPPKAEPGMLQTLGEMNTRYAGASVFLDAIDIAGLRTTIGSSGKDTLYLLARTGQVIANRNNLVEAISHLTNTQRIVYVLGFHARAAQKTNSIRVQLVNVPGSPHVSHRRSFSSTPSSRTSALLLADIVANDIPQSGLSVVASVDAAKPRSATLSITIPGRELLAFGGDHVSAQALLYIFSAAGSVAFQGKEIRIDTKRAAGLEELDLGIRETFELEPGAYTAKVLIRIIGTDVRGFARTEFTVTE